MESSSAPIQDLSVIIPHAKEVVLALQTWMEDVETLSPPSKALHEEANAKFEQLLARMKSNLHARNISRADKAWDEVMRQSHSRQAEQHAFRDKRLKQQKNLLQMKSLFDKLIEQGRLVVSALLELNLHDLFDVSTNNAIGPRGHSIRTTTGWQ